jgi:MFS family permease
MIGNAVGAAVGGALFGPVIGTIAGAIGRGPTFSAVVVVSLALMLAASRLPLVHDASEQGIAGLGAAIRSRVVLAGMWFVALPAVVSGLVSVLGPLRLHRLGAGAAMIGAAFLVGAALEAAVSPAIGSLSDRHGRLVPMRFGLAAAVALLAGFTLPGSPAELALLIVAIAATLGTFWAPAMAMLADAAAASRLDQALAAALMNVAWASGQIIGAAVGGALAKGAGDLVATLLAAALCAVTFGLLTARMRVTPAGSYGIPE